MSAPAIFIFLPCLISLMLLILLRWTKWFQLVSFSAALVLCLLAFGLPIDTRIPLRFWPGLPALVIKTSFSFFGARLIITEILRSMLIYIFTLLFLAQAASYAIPSRRYFIPFGFAFSGLLCAALASTPPSIYAPFFMFVAALLCLPILNPADDAYSIGVIRFLSFQTLGLALTLLGHWSAIFASLHPELEISPINMVLFLAFGFALVLPLFPFHSWVPLVYEKGHPFEISYCLILLAAVNIYLFFNSFVSLTPPDLISTVEPIYLSVILTAFAIAGVWAASEKELYRLVALVVLYQVATLTLAAYLSQGALPSQTNFSLFLRLLLPVGAASFLLSFSIAALAKIKTTLLLDELRGALAGAPFASVGILVSIFSLSGLPLLAGFPIQLQIWEKLASESISYFIWAVTGAIIMGIAGLRIFIYFYYSSDSVIWDSRETRPQIAWILAGLGLLLFLGVYPFISAQ